MLLGYIGGGAMAGILLYGLQFDGSRGYFAHALALASPCTGPSRATKTPTPTACREQHLQRRPSALRARGVCPWPE